MSLGDVPKKGEHGGHEGAEIEVSGGALVSGGHEGTGAGLVAAMEVKPGGEHGRLTLGMDGQAMLRRGGEGHGLNLEGQLSAKFSPKVGKPLMFGSMVGASNGEVFAGIGAGFKTHGGFSGMAMVRGNHAIGGGHGEGHGEGHAVSPSLMLQTSMPLSERVSLTGQINMGREGTQGQVGFSIRLN